MTEVMSLGAAPRQRRRPSRRTLVIGSAVALAVATAAALVVTRPWHTAEPGWLAATGNTCTVGYGSDLLVVAVEVANRSADRAAILGGVGFGSVGPVVTPTGPAIDIVTGTGCDHVLSLTGDALAPGARTWVGLTARVSTCAAVEVPVVVDFDGGGGWRRAHVDVPLAADAVPVCADGT